MYNSINNKLICLQMVVVYYMKFNLDFQHIFNKHNNYDLQ